METTIAMLSELEQRNGRTGQALTVYNDTHTSNQLDV
jgi:hypothetical protein